MITSIVYVVEYMSKDPLLEGITRANFNNLSLATDVYNTLKEDGYEQVKLIKTTTVKQIIAE